MPVKKEDFRRKLEDYLSQVMFLREQKRTAAIAEISKNMGVKTRQFYKWINGESFPNNADDIAMKLDILLPRQQKLVEDKMVQDMKQLENVAKRADQILSDTPESKIMLALGKLEGTFGERMRQLDERMTKLEAALERIRAIEEHEHGPEGFGGKKKNPPKQGIG